MPDFRKLVAPGRKEDPREQEVLSELAGHLEEMYIDLRRAGTPEEQAIAQVTAIGKNLGPSIRRLRCQHEGCLRTWLRSVVLPGLVLFGLYGGCSCLSFNIYWGHQFVWHEAGIVLIAIALGFCASFFSRELGGTRSQRRWAGMPIIAPYAVLWCVWALLAPIQLVQWSTYRRPGGHQWNCRGVPLGMVAGCGAAGPGPRDRQRHLGARLFRDPVEQSKTRNRLIGIGLPRHFLNFRLQLRIR